MNAGSSSDPSPSSDCPRFDVNRGGLRRSRLCAGGSESEEDSDRSEVGEERGSGRGERTGGSTANIDTGRDLGGLGDRERLGSDACAG